MKSKDIDRAITQIKSQFTLGYGDSIPEFAIMQIAGIKEPTNAELSTMTVAVLRATFRNNALDLLSITDRLRDQLLSKGKYLRKSGGMYEIALPSENIQYVEKYRKSAIRKLQRAEKLLQTTPVQHAPAKSNVAARILISQQRASRKSNVTVGHGGVPPSP